MNELAEMKRVQELRVDEFSLQKRREYHETKQELTSQLQETQDQMNFMNDSENVKMWNRITAGDCLTFPVYQQVCQVLVLC